MSEGNRPEPPNRASAVEMVAGFLDFLRATMLWKIDGLPDDALRRPMTPSGVTLLGMIKHLAYVERYWFGAIMAGEDVWLPYTATDPDADWRIEPEETTAEIVALYQRETDRARGIIAGFAWDDMAASPKRQVSLGWILTHMVEETARHCGHADLLREQIDGQTGE